MEIMGSIFSPIMQALSPGADDIGSLAEPFGASMEPLAGSMPRLAPGAAANVVAGSRGFDSGNALAALYALSLARGGLGGERATMPPTERFVPGGAAMPTSAVAPTAVGPPAISPATIRPNLGRMRADWSVAGLSGASPEFMAAMAGLSPDEYETMQASQMTGA